MSELYNQVDECDLHKDILLFFCDSCSKECCYKCLFKNHNGHNAFLNRGLVPRLEKACRSAEETLTSAKIFGDMLKYKNIEFYEQTRSVIKKVQEDAQRCMFLIQKEVANMKEEMDKIVVSNKRRFDEFRETVDKVEAIKIASSEALIACMNREWTQNPEQIVELFKNLDLMNNKLAYLSKKPTSVVIKSLGCSFPDIKYKSHEIIPLLGKLEWNEDKDDVDLHNSSNISFAGKHDSLTTASVISGIENRFGHKIFILSGELNDISSDITINFISSVIDTQAGKEVENEFQDKFLSGPQSCDLFTTNEGTINSKCMVQCILPKESISSVAGVDSIKMAVIKALSSSETFSGRPLVMSACLDDVPYGVGGVILETMFTYLVQKAVESSITVNIIGKDAMVLGILSSTVDLLLKDSLKPEQSLKTTFPSGFQLEICLGSVVEAECDAILIAVHPSLDLKMGSLSRQILDAAGWEIQQECYARKPATFYPGNIVVTKGYNLKCKCVFHGHIDGVCGSVNGESVKCVTINAIKTCLQYGLSSLALPALGTGVGLGDRSSAALILEEIYRFAMFYSFGEAFRRVVIVLHPSNESTVKAFFDHMKALNPQLRVPMWTSIININSDSKTPRKREDVTLDEHKDSMTDDMKQLSLTDESRCQKPSALNGVRVPKPGASQGIWRYREKNGSWVDYPDKINAMLENNYLNDKKTTKWIENGKTYAVSYSSMTEEVLGGDDVVDIKRVEASK